MSQQPNLLPSRNSQGSAPVKSSRPVPLWLLRTEFFLRVMVRLYIGLMVLVLPWTHFWTENRFFLYYAAAAKFALSGVIRGLVSGLGILNVWIALTDAMRYHER
jgi:hypothetical protein